MTTSIETPAELSAFGKARSTVPGSPPRADELNKIDTYWRASLYAYIRGVDKPEILGWKWPF